MIAGPSGKHVKIIWTDTARQRLSQIEDYIAVDNPEVALNFIDGLIESALQLANFPELGGPVTELMDTSFRQLTYHGYRIIYDTAGDAVRIRTVFPGRRLLPTDDLNDN